MNKKDDTENILVEGKSFEPPLKTTEHQKTEIISTEENSHILESENMEDDGGCIYAIGEDDLQMDSSENSQMSEATNAPINSTEKNERTNYQQNNTKPTEEADKNQIQENSGDKQDLPNNSESNSVENTLFIGNLVRKIKKEEVIDYFSKFGKILRFELKENGKFKNSIKFGYLTFESHDSYENVLKTIPHILKEKELKINPATPKMTYNKIIVYDINYLSREKIIEYFEKFGKVTNYEKPEKCKKRSFCFITFDTDEMVKAALTQTTHIIDSKACQVSKASRPRFIFKSREHSSTIKEQPKISKRKEKTLKWLKRKGNKKNATSWKSASFSQSSGDKFSPHHGSESNFPHNKPYNSFNQEFEPRYPYNNRQYDSFNHEFEPRYPNKARPYDSFNQSYQQTSRFGPGRYFPY